MECGRASSFLMAHRHIIGYSVPYKAEAVRPRENMHDIELENDCLPTCVILAHTHTYICDSYGAEAYHITSTGRKSRSPWISWFLTCAVIFGHRRDFASQPCLSAHCVQNKHIGASVMPTWLWLMAVLAETDISSLIDMIFIKKFLPVDKVLIFKWQFDPFWIQWHEIWLFCTTFTDTHVHCTQIVFLEAKNDYDSWKPWFYRDYFDFFPYATVILQIFCRDFLAAVYIKLAAFGGVTSTHVIVSCTFFVF